MLFNVNKAPTSEFTVSLNCVLVMFLNLWFLILNGVPAPLYAARNSFTAAESCLDLL